MSCNIVLLHGITFLDQAQMLNSLNTSNIYPL